MTREEAIEWFDRQIKSMFATQTYIESDKYRAYRMAIEALSRSGDLISKADAMSKCKNAEKELTDEAERKGLRVARFIIGELPSADAEWIPCSERLPSKDGDYLVCMAWTYSNINVFSWADGWNCHRDYDGKISRESEIEGADIIAWMPLPTPYKGGDDE